MVDYKTLYHKLYNRITNVIEELQQAQQETEALYTDDGDADIMVLGDKKKGGTPGEKEQ